MTHIPMKKHPLTLIIISIIILPLFIYVNSETQPTHIVILHINDTHGNLIAYDKTNQVGGIARMATIINQVRSENKDNTLVLHAGDEFSRGDEITVCFGGEPNMLAIEMMGYDAFTPGNGDFYYGVKNLIKQTSLIKVPILLSNIVYKDTNERIFQPYIIKEIKGIKIGIFGLGVIREDHPSSRNIKQLDPIVVAKEIIPELRKKSDIIIALTHIGIGADILLAQKLPEIDIIVGGHTHNKLDKPMTVPRKNGKGEVIIVQAGEYTQFLGRLDMYVQKNQSNHYEIVNSDGQLIPIDGKVQEDKAISEFLKQYTDKLSQKITTFKNDIPKTDKSDSPIGKFLAEAVKIETNSDISLLDLSSAQSGIKAGDLTLGQIYKIHPWRNQILIYQLKGEQIQKILYEKDAFVFGCDYEKSNGKINKLMINEKEADLNKIYKVAVDEYLSYSLKSLKNISYLETDKTIDDIFLEYLKNNFQ